MTSIRRVMLTQMDLDLHLLASERIQLFRIDTLTFSRIAS